MLERRQTTPEDVGGAFARKIERAESRVALAEGLAADMRLDARTFADRMSRVRADMVVTRLAGDPKPEPIAWIISRDELYGGGLLDSRGSTHYDRYDTYRRRLAIDLSGQLALVEFDRGKSEDRGVLLNRFNGEELPDEYFLNPDAISSAADVAEIRGKWLGDLDTIIDRRTQQPPVDFDIDAH